MFAAAFSGTGNGIEGANGLQGAFAAGAGMPGALNTGTFWMTLESNSISVVSTGTTSSAVSIADWEDSY